MLPETIDTVLALIFWRTASTGSTPLGGKLTGRARAWANASPAMRQPSAATSVAHRAARQTPRNRARSIADTRCQGAMAPSRMPPRLRLFVEHDQSALGFSQIMPSRKRKAHKRADGNFWI